MCHQGPHPNISHCPLKLCISISQWPQGKMICLMNLKELRRNTKKSHYDKIGTTCKLHQIHNHLEGKYGLAPFHLLHQRSSFGIQNVLSCLWSCSGDFEGLSLCAWVVFAMWTSIALTQKVASTVAQVSSWSFEGLSQVLLLALRQPHWAHDLSCCSMLSCHQNMLSVWSQCHIYTSSLALTLNHFS